MEEKEFNEIVGEELTPKQEAFCQFYTQISSTFGNATTSYAQAYDYDLDNASKDDAIYRTRGGAEGDREWLETLPNAESDGSKIIQASTFTRWEHTCQVAGSRLLRNVVVDKRVRSLLNEMMTNEVIDARLVDIIMKGDDKDSIQAIKEFNKLKQRIIEKKDITSGGEKISGFNFVRADEVTSGYVDSRTPKEREADSKVEVTTTTSDALPEPMFVRLPTVNLNESDNPDNQTHT